MIPKKMAERLGIATEAKELPAAAWPGGYPIVYIDDDGDTLCHKCAFEKLNDYDNPNIRPRDFFIHYEGASVFCALCNEEIESAYGDPDAEGED